MHELIIRATPGHTAKTRYREGSVRGIESWMSDFGGFTLADFLKAADSVYAQIKYLPEHEPHRIRRLVDLTQDWLDLIELARLAGGDEVKAFAVVSTYDPNGSFCPGTRVVWSGHFTREEAEAALPKWEAHLNRPRDPMVVEESYPVPVRSMKTPDWKGPTR